MSKDHKRSQRSQRSQQSQRAPNTKLCNAFANHLKPHRTIGLGMLADVYPPDNLGVVMGIVMMANAIGFIMGPMVGAYFYEYHGYAAPFIFCAALAVVDFMCILFIAEPEKKKITSAGSIDDDDAEQDVSSLIIAEDPKRQPIKSDHSPSYGSTSSNSSSSSVASSSSSTRSSAPSSCSSVSEEEEDKKSDGAGADVSMFTIASNWTITCCLLATFVAASVFSGKQIARWMEMIHFDKRTRSNIPDFSLSLLYTTCSYRIGAHLAAVSR